MKGPWMIALAAAAVACAQTGSIELKPLSPPTASPRSVSPAIERTVPAAGPPMLGFVAGPDPAELRAIAGGINKPQLGSQIALPAGTTNLFLPPRQAYALLATASDEPLAVWPLYGVAAATGQQHAVAIVGAMARPDMVIFSPRGVTSGLYSQAGSTLQVVKNLPAQPAIENISLAGMGVPSRFAVSDDATVVAASFADGRFLIHASGENWSTLPLGFMPRALSFVPNSHDLIFSDTAQKTIALLEHVEDLSGNARILAQDIQADRLAVARDGEHVIAADSSAAKIWTIDLQAGTVVPAEISAKMEDLVSLRDGFTFLLATTPELTVWRVPGATAQFGSGLSSNNRTEAPVR